MGKGGVFCKSMLAGGVGRGGDKEDKEDKENKEDKRYNGFPTNHQQTTINNLANEKTLFFTSWDR